MKIEKGTLIKRGEEDYKLFVNDTPLGQSKESPYKKLSLKNCQAIENGYDLDELARNYVDEQPNDFLYTTDEYWNAQVDFQKGFQKAIELMEEKLHKQNEWEVEIEMEEVRIDKVRSLQFSAQRAMNAIEAGMFPKPKLDADGCLILKRI
jgi:hypothetical protein